jgi:cell division protein FtsW (lipid II flippase)
MHSARCRAAGNHDIPHSTGRHGTGFNRGNHAPVAGGNLRVGDGRMSTASATAVTVAPTAPRRRRYAELALLVLALAVGGAGYVAASVGYSGEVPADVVTVVGAFAVLFLVAHVAVRRLAPYADPLLLPLAAFLNMLGLVLIHRLDLADADRAERAGRAIPRADAVAQLTWTAVGLTLFVLVLVLVRDHRILQRFTYTALFAGVALLLMPLLPIVGTSINGARLWVRLGPLSFQPAEVAKLCLIVFFAGYLVTTRDALATVRTRIAGIDLPRGRDLGPLLIAWLAAMSILVFQRDLGTALLFFGLFVGLLYVATERRSWLVLGAVIFLSGAFVAWLSFSHVQTRVSVWLDPFSDPTGPSFQIVQSLFGLAAGGLLGTGLGVGNPQFVPFAKTDFIVATAGEELGLTGLVAILIVYAMLVQRGFRAGVAARDAFGTLLASGLSIVLALQIFVVVGGVTRLVPLTGLTMPFMSYGGSSLVANWMIIALLMRISDVARRPAPAPEPDRDDAVTQVVRL